MSLTGQLLLLVVLALLRSRSEAREASCDGYCPMFTMEQSLQKFRSAVDGVYSGQEDAISGISRALMTNMIDNTDLLANTMPMRRAKPLLLHFTGPTGVGKTLMAQILKESLFVSECGVKKIHLDVSNKYSDKAGQRERIDAMKRSIVEQLERCPRSLIIFDDFQWAPEMMIFALRDAFDEDTESVTFRNKRVSTSKAIFVFCSDLESEQRHLHVDMSMEQARRKVSELAAKQWRMVDSESGFGRLFLNQGMVPFVPLSEAELRKVIHIEIGKLTPRLERYLSFHASNATVDFKWLGRVRWNEKRLDPVVLQLLGDDLREYNARAIRNLIERHLLVHATSVGKCLVAHAVRTEHKGWLWGSTLNLLDDVKVEDVDHSHFFTVNIGDAPCISAPGGGGGGGGGGKPDNFARASPSSSSSSSSPSSLSSSSSPSLPRSHSSSASAPRDSTTVNPRTTAATAKRSIPQTTNSPASSKSQAPRKKAPGTETITVSFSPDEFDGEL